MCLNMLDSIRAIYEDIFCNTFSQSCYVFLCGGAGKDHIRNKIRPLLENKHFQVLYPEDLFIEMLNRDKKSDLLEYENLLAENSDIICVICESIGSAVELGAFIQNEEIKNKMIVAINQRYSRDKSFVMMGPIKHLKKTNDNSVVVFKNDAPEALGVELSIAFHRLRKKTMSNKNQSFNTLATYISFIPMIVYFYKTTSRKSVHKNLKIFLSEQKKLPAKYNELFNAAIKYLIKIGTIETAFDISKEDETFSLSSKGYHETLDFIGRSSARNKSRLHDKIRCAILKEQLYD